MDHVPLQDYESLFPYIDRMMHGEENVLWEGVVKWYSKSSGTTSHKSKFIPVSKVNLNECHIKGSWNTMALLYNNYPDLEIFAEKNLVISGSVKPFEEHPETMRGDISAIMVSNMPIIGRPFYTPDFQTALMDDWDSKFAKTLDQVIHQNVVSFGGVPTWNIVLFNMMLEMTGKKHMMEIWPNVKVYVHGGVGFDPYIEQFKKLFPSDKMIYQEAYNASEGFFAAQDQKEPGSMLLMLDVGIFYEFIPYQDWLNNDMDAVTIRDVEVDKPYVLVISTNSGLWRYIPGDTIIFTSLKPHRVKVLGRTRQFINAFGEEVIISNTDKAISQTCNKHECIVREYTVAPVYFENVAAKGSHQWVIEFEKSPANIEAFRTDLDLSLQALNTDYAAKRYHDMALEKLQLITVPPETFTQWMRSRGRYGGQNKVPRLSNDRTYVESLIEFIKKKSS
jgi:hypothetical protein